MGSRRVAVVMAGGSGTRFWPVSTADRPKQFLRLASADATLLEQSVARIAPLVGDDLYVATSAALVPATQAALPHLRVIGEPARRNTLGALVWATANLMAEGDWEETTVAVLTADHAIEPAAAFLVTVSKAMALAEETGALVTIGIKPTRPATEFGYVELGAEIGDRAWRARRFTEKPDSATAGEFVASGRFLWNSGMFFWTLRSFLDELAFANAGAAELTVEIADALSRGQAREAASRFEQLPSISVDYALMERARNVAVVESEFEWDDLGSWDALSRSLEPDGHGNVTQGHVRTVDSAGCVVYNDSPGQRVSVLGMDDVVVAVTGAEVMVCRKDRAQDVRELAD